MLCSYFGKLLMGLRFRFCLFAWSTEEFGDINKSCTYRILSVSAIEKRDTRKNLVSFFYALRPKKRCFTPIGRRCAKIKPDEIWDSPV